MYSVIVSRTFHKQFHFLQKQLQKRIRNALKKLEIDPNQPGSGADIKPLTTPSRIQTGVPNSPSRTLPTYLTATHTSSHTPHPSHCSDTLIRLAHPTPVTLLRHPDTPILKTNSMFRAGLLAYPAPRTLHRPRQLPGSRFKKLLSRPPVLCSDLESTVRVQFHTPPTYLDHQHTQFLRITDLTQHPHHFHSIRRPDTPGSALDTVPPGLAR